MLACQGRSPTTAIKQTNTDDANIVQLNSLFQAIIGRPPGKVDHKINGITPANLAGLGDKIYTYEQQVEAILNSQQFIDRGFFHLHQQRMNLLERVDAGIIEIYSPNDFGAIHLELNKLAENSKNYWNILTYRHRYLPIRDLMLPGRIGVDFEDLESVKRDIIKIVKNEFREEQVYYPYQDRCCTESQEPKERHKSFCEEADTAVKDVFGVDNFCSLANNSTELAEDNKSPNKDGETAGSKLRRAVNLYLSLILGIRTDDWFSVEIGATEDKKLPIVRFRSENYLKVKFPEELQGIHASPFWLWKHRTSPVNQHLRRARAIYHSWFCGEVSPDQAIASPDQPTVKELDEFSDYFADDDKHAKGDNNCFGCHKMVQPLANYFGKLAGYPPVESDNFYGLGVKFLARPEESFDRPAGYWQGEFKGGFHGLAGLAKSLPAIPQVSECLVNSTWNTMLGSDLPQLTADEVTGAISKFNETGNNYRELLKYLLLTEKATTYFTEGRSEMEKKFADESSCPEEMTFADIKEIITDSCATANCHNNNRTTIFNNDDNTFLDEKLPSAYERVTGIKQPLMPMNTPLSIENKKDLICYLKQRLLAVGKEIPTKGEISDEPHEILGTDQ